MHFAFSISTLRFNLDKEYEILLHNMEMKIAFFSQNTYDVGKFDILHNWVFIVILDLIFIFYVWMVF